MKKIILIAALFTVSASAAFSQNIEWGAKAGLNLSTVTKVDDSKMRAGFYAGVMAEHVINDFWGIQGELLFSQMGTKYDGTDIAEKNSYIVLPVLAKLYVAPLLSIDLGPQFGYMISAQYDDHNVYKDVDNKFDVSFAMGLSYKIGGRFDITGRYNLGLTKVGEGDESGKNSVLQFGVGYRF